MWGAVAWVVGIGSAKARLIYSVVNGSRPETVGSKISGSHALLAVKVKDKETLSVGRGRVRVRGGGAIQGVEPRGTRVGCR